MRSIQTIVGFLGGFALLGWAASSASAQDTAPPATRAETRVEASEDPAVAGAAAGDRPPQFALKSYGGHGFETDFSDRDGSMSLNWAGVEFSAIFAVGERDNIGLTLNAEQAWYDFEGLSISNAALGPSPVEELWGDVRTVGTTVSWFRKIDERWSSFISGQVESSGEDGAAFEDTLTFGGTAAFTYQLNDSLELGAGLVVMSRLEDNALIIPMPIVGWQIDERWKLATDFDFDRDGVGVKLSYELTEAITLGAKGGFLSRDFRLSEDNAASEGVGRHGGLPVRLSVDWQFAPWGTLWVWGGYLFAQELELDTRSGDEIGKFDMDASPMVGVGLSLEF